ncbi:predicted protein [Naegleria gruberi]|uniref:Predicted protein n=1 Tax=Naegleria gruberi TaxID=5762 RepID=D2VM05_NAEGR|nr:uncharacterized protein NAEGRDRAFT_69965 [Naegleria gruberi]EFC42236.1 predicted protein [Naegleria gruberi]|eukprot:XP_002674980.1 predicted protein [Naegleria gruberi strain NEG-M]
MSPKVSHHSDGCAPINAFIVMMIVVCFFGIQEVVRGAELKMISPLKDKIMNVPYLHQITDYSCGDASLNMVLSYYYREKFIDQRAIIDVARTSNHSGTLSLDVVRGARFSPISSTPQSQHYIQFPEVSPKNGWFGLANNSFASIPANIFEHSGLVTLYYPDRNTLLPCEQARQDTTTKCWVDSLVNQFLKNDIPVMCLMKFKDSPTSSGHYRVAVGYETSNNQVSHIIMLDPWDRDGNPTTVRYSVSDFCNMWKHAEPNDDKTCFKPFFAVAAFPLDVSMTPVKENDFNIKVKYPCVAPPSSTKRDTNLPLTTTIQNLHLEIALLSAPNSQGKATILHNEQIPLIDSFVPCETQSLFWRLPNIGKTVDSIRVISKGMVCDTVLPTEYDSGIWSPAYKYCDFVGGISIRKL